jgi:hypothetical protein
LDNTDAGHHAFGGFALEEAARSGAELISASTRMPSPIARSIRSDLVLNALAGDADRVRSASGLPSQLADAGSGHVGDPHYSRP